MYAHFVSTSGDRLPVTRALSLFDSASIHLPDQIRIHDPAVLLPCLGAAAVDQVEDYNVKS